MGASAAAAAIVIRERHIVEAYRQAGAMSPDAAATPDSLGVSERMAFRILVRDAVLRQTQPGFYYLDELSWDAKQGIRRRVALVMLAIAAVLFSVFGVARAIL